MMNKNVLIILVTLVIGVALGFSWGKQQSSAREVHRMPDGSLMSNDMDMATMMADMNRALAGKRGDPFDKAFIEEMVIHHQGAVDMAKLALTNAKHQEIKDLANAIIVAQTKEIGQMGEWLKSWYNQ